MLDYNLVSPLPANTQGRDHGTEASRRRRRLSEAGIKGGQA